jgi:SAM-dependent methyltransferase
MTEHLANAANTEFTTQIGKVKINYDYASDTDGVYSEGDDAEAMILDFLKETQGLSKYDKHLETLKFLQKGRMYQLLYQLSPHRKNIAEVFEFTEKPLRILEVGSGMGAVTEGIAAKFPNSEIICVDLSARRSLANAYRNSECVNITIYVGDLNKIAQNFEKFDRVVLIGVLEYAAVYTTADNPFQEFLAHISDLLKNDGKLYIAIENRLGIKYFAGVVEDHHGSPFVGIENYPKSSTKGRARTFSRSELKTLLELAGFNNQFFYYPYPDYKLPTVIFSDKRLPDGSDFLFESTFYGVSNIEVFNQERAVRSLNNEDFGIFSNSFLVECAKDDSMKLGSVDYVKISDMRIPEFSEKTHIAGNQVVKSAIFPQGQETLKVIADNYERIKDYYPDVKVNKAVYKNNQLFMDFEPHTHTLVDLYKSALAKSTSEFWRVFEYHSEIAGLSRNIIEFVDTPQFTERFGNGAGFIGSDAVAFVNSEAIPGNVLFNDDDTTPIFIDYEFVWDFPVPVALVKYHFIRVLSNYFNVFYEMISENEIAERLGQENLAALSNAYAYYHGYLAKQHDAGDCAVSTIVALYKLPNKNYPGQIKELQNGIEWHQQHDNEQLEEIKELQNSIKWHQQRDNEQQAHIVLQNSEISNKFAQIKQLEQAYSEIVSSKSWKITKPLRFLRRIFK